MTSSRHKPFNPNWTLRLVAFVGGTTVIGESRFQRTSEWIPPSCAGSNYKTIKGRAGWPPRRYSPTGTPAVALSTAAASHEFRLLPSARAAELAVRCSDAGILSAILPE